MPSCSYDLSAVGVSSKGRLIQSKELEAMSKHLKIKKDMPTKNQIAEVNQLIYNLLLSELEKKETKNFKLDP